MAYYVLNFNQKYDITKVKKVMNAFIHINQPSQGKMSGKLNAVVSH